MVVAPGFTRTQVLPVTSPMLLSMLTEVAPVRDQESMVGTPAATWVWAVPKRVIAGAPWTLADRVKVQEVEPTLLDAVTVQAVGGSAAARVPVMMPVFGSRARGAGRPGLV